jgi:apolipoprotein N-acyltransferase
VGVVICYEDFYSEEVRALSRKGAEVLVNITNEHWFSHGAAQEQHLRAIALRAIESRRFFLRAANTGISAVIDPVGRIRRRVAIGERGYIRETVALMDRPTLQTSLGRLLYRLAAAAVLLIGAAAFFLPECKK